MLASKSLLQHPAGTIRPAHLGRRWISRPAAPSPTAWRWWPAAASTPCSALSAKRDWDLAAGDIIVREAGGCVSDARRPALCATMAQVPPPSLRSCAAPELRNCTRLIALMRLKTAAIQGEIAMSEIQTASASGARRRTGRTGTRLSSRTCPSSTSSACIPISRQPRPPGAARRRPPSTMPRCAISSSICTG